MGRIKYRSTKLVYSKLDERFEFGKHKGNTIGWILDNEPQWIKYYLTIISGFKLEADVLDRYLQIYPN